jgi:hypothetical protein
VRVVKEDVYNAWVDAMKQAAAMDDTVKAEKDKDKRKELLKQKKDLLQKAKDIVKQAALEQAGVRHFASASTAH